MFVFIHRESLQNDDVLYRNTIFYYRMTNDAKSNRFRRSQLSSSSLYYGYVVFHFYIVCGLCVIAKPDYKPRKAVQELALHTKAARRQQHNNDSNMQL